MSAFDWAIVIEGVLKTLVSPREAVEDQEGGEKISTDGENGDREKKLIQTDSGGLEGGNFAVAGQPSKGEEDSQENGHRDGEDEERRGDKEEKLQNLRNVDPPGHNQFDQFENLIHQENDRKDHQTDEKNGKNFFEDVEIGGLFHLSLDRRHPELRQGQDDPGPDAVETGHVFNVF